MKETSMLRISVRGRCLRPVDSQRAVMKCQQAYLLKWVLQSLTVCLSQYAYVGNIAGNDILFL